MTNDAKTKGTGTRGFKDLTKGTKTKEYKDLTNDTKGAETQKKVERPDKGYKRQRSPNT